MVEVSIDTLRGVTQRVVDVFTQGGMLFTALDVSNAVKQTLPTVRHREVAPIVRDLFAAGAMGESYAQTLIDVVAERKDVQAFLYHLKGADIALGYGEEMRRQLAIPPVSASLEDDGDAQAPEVTEVALSVGADGRLRVPVKLLQLAGITTPRVTAERVGDEIFLRMAITGMASSGTVIELVHPTLLHVPVSLACIFDEAAPIRARVDRFQVKISGTIVPT